MAVRLDGLKPGLETVVDLFRFVTLMSQVVPLRLDLTISLKRLRKKGFRRSDWSKLLFDTLTSCLISKSGNENVNIHRVGIPSHLHALRLNCSLADL